MDIQVELLDWNNFIFDQIITEMEINLEISNTTSCVQFI